MYKKKIINRIACKLQRIVTSNCFRRPLKIKTNIPIISFSFDDAPKTAFDNGGKILKAHGAQATFFVSLGLLESESPSGTIASKDDLCHAVEEGHELGCHTFDHKDPWNTTTKMFEKSVLKNRQALARILPKTNFTVFAYPICGPRPAIKRRVGNLFRCCRGGGQTFNAGNADLNLLKAFFLDIRNGDNIDIVRRLIDQNSKYRGWLIFATHDVIKNPSPYGCGKTYFEKVVAYSTLSGARLLPVGIACQELLSHYSESAITI